MKLGESLIHYLFKCKINVNIISFPLPFMFHTSQFMFFSGKKIMFSLNNHFASFVYNSISLLEY